MKASEVTDILSSFSRSCFLSAFECHSGDLCAHLPCFNPKSFFPNELRQQFSEFGSRISGDPRDPSGRSAKSPFFQFHICTRPTFFYTSTKKMNYNRLIAKADLRFILPIILSQTFKRFIRHNTMTH